MNTRHDVFLSHASEDRLAAERLRSALIQRGMVPWLDTAGIQAGRQWLPQIEQGLQSCTAFAVVATHAAMQSKFVQTEYCVAIDLIHRADHTLLLLPLLFEDVTLPLTLRSFQYVDFRRENDFDLRVDELCRAITSAKANSGTASGAFTTPGSAARANASLKLRFLDDELARQQRLLRQLQGGRLATAMAAAPAIAVAVFFSSFAASSGSALLLAIVALMTVAAAGWGATFVPIEGASARIAQLKLLRDGLSGCVDTPDETCAEWRAQFWRLVPGAGPAHA